MRQTIFTKLKRQRRMRALVREALYWRDRLEDQDDPLANLEFAHWILKSPEHVQAWLELTAFDEAAAEYLGYPDIGAIVAPVPDPYDRTATDDEPALSATGAQHRRTRWTAVSAAAAALVTVAVAALFALRVLTPSVERYTTVVGELRSIPLNDGSLVRLNTASSLEVRFSPNARHLRLVSGEASFHVHHDVSRPFDVEADHCGTIRAVGTVFSVRIRKSSSCDVVVTEGRVLLLGLKGPAIANTTHPTLSAHELASIRPTTFRIEAVSPQELANRIAWEDGMLRFRSAPMSEIVEEFNRYHTDRLIIDDAALASTLLGGSYRATDLRRFVNSLRDLDIEAKEVHQRNGIAEFHLRRLKPPPATQP